MEDQELLLEGTYIAIYKCRVCGKIFAGNRIGYFKENAARKALNDYLSSNMFKISLHQCMSDGYGIADMAGFILEDK